MQGKIVVTTTQAGRVGADLAAFLEETGWEYVPRQRRSLETIRKATGAEGVVVWQEEGPVLHLANGRFFFHPSMAKNRLSQHRKGLTVDVMERLVGLRPGDSFLDCTLGLGADAIVASYLTGAVGRVVGLESSPVVAPIVKWGMKVYTTPMAWLGEAIRRIEVVQAAHLSYLRAQPSESYDIVYFDPMFAVPVMKSQAISPLRSVADHSPLSREAVEEGTRVARRRVVVKERRESPVFARLGINDVRGGESSRVAYGIITLNQP